MIYISCSDEEYENILNALSTNEDFCPLEGDCREDSNCKICWGNYIKRINTDITPDEPNYSTAEENKAFLQGFNVAVKKMRGEIEE